jgi:hypothetical protein
MLLLIISGIVQALFVACIAAFVLQLASKIICGESVEYGDAFKASFIALIASQIISWGIPELLGTSTDWWLTPIAKYLVWSIVIAVVIGLTVGRSFLVALVMWGLGLLLGFLAVMVLAALAL